MNLLKFLCRKAEERKKGLKTKNKMKKVFLVLVIFFATGITFAQEKGLHLMLGGGAGRTNFIYDLDDGSNHRGIGYGGFLGIQYFFNQHWGLSLAGELFVFNTQSRYANKLFEFKNQIDDERYPYDLNIRLKDWQETQQTHFIEIPLMGIYQHKWGRRERVGFYVGLGVKAQIPVSYSFAVDGKGNAVASGYYPKWHLTLGDGEKGVFLPQHAYGMAKPEWKGTHNLKTGFAAVGEFGFLFGLSRRVDLTLGVSVDYGFTNVYKGKEDLLGPTGKTLQEGNAKPTENVFYNGILNSNQISYLNTTSLRGKVGLRIKLGKLKEIPDFDDEEEYGRRGSRTPIIDTIFVYPIVVYKDAQYQQSDYENGIGGGEGVSRRSGRANNPTGYNYGSMLEKVEEELEESIYFDFGKSTLTAESKDVLNRKAELMKKYPQVVLSVVGHTCNIGSSDLNDKLSYERAEAARVYLIKKGISPSRIVPIPQGMKNPTYPNTSEPNRELNRRVDFYLSY